MSAAFIKRATHVNIFQLKIEIFPKHDEQRRTAKREMVERMEEQQARDSPASQTWPDVDVDVDAAADADVGCGCHTGQCGASSAATPAATPNFLPLSLSFSFCSSFSILSLSLSPFLSLVNRNTRNKSFDRNLHRV